MRSFISYLVSDTQNANLVTMLTARGGIYAMCAEVSQLLCFTLWAGASASSYAFGLFYQAWEQRRRHAVEVCQATFGIIDQQY